ncbi:mycothiol acetyltransferase [Nocardioides flavus (ex Wang et al. 2016)]|uniref:Mycothiol acetyltransferase n=1 Tax=Nocardioides flavus (ex Wang et al. 2016) TaxID=2058780 RepID=A0ABQ3HD51_9ACTN|nr:mycothiol synthase [Nocardioides flavus (ex Wang et al. 2016)]GHE14996.1 mycothiol acetyltransferase [Nocardioides flavus (ex Wang et al. 2016)]
MSATTDLVEQVAAEATVADGADPLDEATRIALADGAAEVVAEDDAFALLHDGDLSLVVRPSARRRGLGSALLGRVEESYAGQLVAWSHGNHPAAARLAATHGWERVRDLWVMRRPAARELPPLEPPAGVTIRGYRDGDAADVVAINAAAFADHPEQGAMDLDNLARRMAEPWFDPAGLLVAEDASGILGFHWTKQHDARLGEVYVVGVSPAAQGRGLGKVLTLAGLHHLAGLGVDEVLLYVESDNAPAVAVYSRLGFEHADADTHVQYRRG